MAILLPLLVCLLPLLITPGILFHYDITPKVITLTLTVSVCLLFPRQVSEGMTALWSRKSGRWLCALAAVQSLWCAAATGFSTRPWFSLLGSNWRRMGLLTIVALCVFAVLAGGHLSRRPESFRPMLRAFALATIAASLYGILQYFDIDPLQTASGYHAQAGDSTIVRPPGTLGHADYFGWWLSMALFCAIGLARIERAFWKGIAFLAGVLTAIAIVLSGTRSAILAVAVGFVSLAVFGRVRPRRKHYFGGLAAAGLLIAFYLSPAGTRLQARVRWSSDEVVTRPLLWRDSLRMVASRPWTGFGPETFAAEFPRYESIELAQRLPDFYYESPHNTALDSLTSEGFPGLLITLAWIALGFYAVRNGWRTPSAVRAALASALVASCVASLFVAATAGPVFATLLVIAMLVALDTEVAASRFIVRPGVLLAFSAPVAVCLAIFGLTLTVADFALERFQSRGGDPAAAVTLYDSAARLALPGAAEDLYCSRRLATLCGGSPDPAVQFDCVKAATRAAERATNTADNPPNGWYNFGMFSAEQDDARKVEEALRTSSALAPNWFKPHWALANLLALTGRSAEARREAERASLLDGGKNPEVSQTLAKLTQVVR